MSFFKEIISTIQPDTEILGLNERNLIYLRPSNKKHSRRIADNKLITKKYLAAHDIPSPEVLGQIRNLEQLEKFDWSQLPKSFVIKPKKGYEGRGIMVITGRSNKTGQWRKADGKLLEEYELKDQIIRILDGEYSLRNESDTAFFERKVNTHKNLKPFTYKGVPDIRVIVYNKVPVMAELRLPTKASDGKANLHRGGIIVGIDMASGTTTTAVQYNNIIETHPDNHMILSGIKIPFWNKVLEYAVKCQMITDIGFLGADIILDDEFGPMVMELNARPGLGIQIANQDGLKGRLMRVKGLKIKTITRGVNVGRNLFGGDVEESIEEISGKQVVGIFEKARFNIYKSDAALEFSVKNDTGAFSTSINHNIAQKLGYGEVLEYFHGLDFVKRHLKYTEARAHYKEWNKIAKQHPMIRRLVIVKSGNGISIRPIVMLRFEMSGVVVDTRVTIEEREGLRYPIIIGRRDLKRFLLDITKKL